MVAHPFRNNQQSCQSIGENATLFLSEHTLFSCDLQWMPKDCHFDVKNLPRRLIQRAKRANLPLKPEHLPSNVSTGTKVSGKTAPNLASSIDLL
jgi:hypothetical protein